MKSATFVLSDPESVSEESLGRVFNVLAAGYDLLTENLVPETTGLPSLRRLSSKGYSILTF